MTTLHYLTIAEAGDLLRSHQISPVELTRGFLDRIEQADHQLHAYITVTGDMALKEARTHEAEMLRGEYRGPLHGVPVALKDLYATQGILTTAHSRLLAEWIPDEDATAVARLREAGTVLLGKLSMWEFAGGLDLQGPFPVARNPWNPDYAPGGSSSGSGVAVAAGLCMGSLGSDTGGSIRGPASLCGIVGLKPTYGRVSRFGVIPLSWSLDHCGPMTWTVEDAALMLQAIAGYDPKDPTSSKAPVPNYSQALKEDIRGLVVGIPRHYFFRADGVDGETLEAVETAIKVLEERGAKTKVVEIPSIEQAATVRQIIWASEVYSYHEANNEARRQDYGPRFRDRMTMGAFYTAADYIQALRWREILRREFQQVLEGVDVLATPTSAQPAGLLEQPPFTEDTVSGRRPTFTGPFNTTGLPAISVCCGFTSRELPIGLQIVGRPFDEPTILRVAHSYEKATPWREKRPSI
ncbi:MAG: Asp-tRNA(Asn)/Glu-tRNA(Gln) amidotransferase subunit GatA [Chloroflexi bacterium]|nr:Asp-tRNA(Asn)/Glu-tRNA(Gln) amidotransferase subunit GatA [Chloroflexota bacterium]